jgi:uncharacterized delta-60 repeat protein
MRIVKGLVPAVAVVLVTALAAAPARGATVVSETTWGGASTEETHAAAVAPDGSTYLAGVTRSFDPSGQEQRFLVKFAADGSLSWQRSWEGPAQFGLEQADGVAVASDGSVYVTGETAGAQRDALLLKFAPDGTLVWKRSWGGGGTEGATGVAVAGDGAVYVTGNSDSFGGFGHQFFLRFAPDGTLVWQRIRSVATDASLGIGQGIAVAADGSVYGAGAVPGSEIGAFDLLLVKLNPDGTLVWQRSYSAGDVADARGGVTVAGDGSVYVAGGVQAVTRRTAVNDTLVVKFAPDGSLLWDRQFGGDQGDFPGGVAARADGTIAIGGETASFGAGSDDAFLLQLDATGKATACNTWGGQGLDHGDDVDVAPDGILSLGATTESLPPFTFGDCPRRTRRPHGTVAAPDVPLTPADGVVADPALTVVIPNGTSPGGGGFDAALVRIAS